MFASGNVLGTVHVDITLSAAHGRNNRIKGLVFAQNSRIKGLVFAQNNRIKGLVFAQNQTKQPSFKLHLLRIWNALVTNFDVAAENAHIKVGADLLG